MVNYLLKKSYQRKNFKEIEFDDLWNKDGVFTTMWIYNKPPKILFFKTHIDNLIKSLKAYKIYDKGIKSKILRLINENIDKTKLYNHLLRVALNKKTISISLRDRVKPKQKFGIKLVHYERVKPEYKNLKYKKILGFLSKMNTSKEDIALCVNDKIFETGTSNLLFVKDQKFFTPKKDYYEGNTYKFFKTKIRKIFKKDILLKEIKNYDEILLIGSGKGVASVRTINELKWKRKNLKKFKFLSKEYDAVINKCNYYRF